MKLVQEMALEIDAAFERIEYGRLTDDIGNPLRRPSDLKREIFPTVAKTALLT
jgi:hypothetical protein